jgi:hypothetical protein
MKKEDQHLADPPDFTNHWLSCPKRAQELLLSEEPL